MTPQRPLLVALFSLVGAASVNAALLACSSPGSRAGGAAGLAPEKTAEAQECQPAPAAAAPRCAAWEVKAFLPARFAFATVPMVNSDGKRDAISLPVAEGLTLPDGWEPFAAEGYGAITARHCLD